MVASVPVRPGDLMSASVVQAAGTGQWTITITDEATGASFSTTQAYSGPQTSAEWIEEAPTLGGHIATLAHYGLATFDAGSAAFANSVNGANPGLTSSESGVMIQGRSQVSTPSPPDSDTDGFNMEYGSKVPPAPRS